MLLYLLSNRDRRRGAQRFLAHGQRLLNRLVFLVPPHLRGNKPPLWRWSALELSFVPASTARPKVFKHEPDVIRVSVILFCRLFEGAGSRAPSSAKALPRAGEEFLDLLCQGIACVIQGNNLFPSLHLECFLSSLYS